MSFCASMCTVHYGHNTNKCWWASSWSVGGGGAKEVVPSGTKICRFFALSISMFSSCFWITSFRCSWGDRNGMIQVKYAASLLNKETKTSVTVQRKNWCQCGLFSTCAVGLNGSMWLLYPGQLNSWLQACLTFPTQTENSQVMHWADPQCSCHSFVGFFFFFSPLGVVSRWTSTANPS